MMEQQLVIARAIASHAPVGWTKAWVSARVDEDYVGNLKADYVDQQGQEHWFDLDNASDVMSMSKAILAMRDTMRQGEKQPWSNCTFTLFPNGEFKFDVAYDD